MIYNYDMIMIKMLIYFVCANGYISLAHGSLMLIYSHHNVFGYLLKTISYLQKRQFVSLCIRLCACNFQMANRDKATNNIFSIILTLAVRFSLCPVYKIIDHCSSPSMDLRDTHIIFNIILAVFDFGAKVVFLGYCISLYHLCVRLYYYRFILK